MTFISQNLPLGATMDLQRRLPPIQQILWSPTIMVSLILIVIAIAVLVYLSARARVAAKKRKRVEDLRIFRSLLTRRGGTDEDIVKMDWIFATYPKIDPAASVLVVDAFERQLRPMLEKHYDAAFAERMVSFFFPPPKDSKVIAKESNLRKLVHDSKTTGGSQANAAMIDLMDATLRPGIVLHIAFDGVDGSYDCLVMSYDMKSLNITLPANNARLLTALRPGMGAEGTLENGATLMAFTSMVETIVAGSMPFCRLSIWKNAWEVRKRESVRLGISIEIDFQHISAASSGTVRVSQLEKEIGTIRPGRLCDLSLGGGCLETPLDSKYSVGDFIRFTTSLIPGHPPATLLGAIVEIDDIAHPEHHNGMIKRLHIQFLALDDISQRLLVRAMRQLQDIANRVEWQRSQRIMEQMRRNNIPVSEAASRPAASPASSSTRTTAPKTSTTVFNDRRGMRNAPASPPQKTTPRNAAQSTSIRITPPPEDA